MTVPLAPQQLFTTSLLTLLRASAGSGVAVGDHAVPTDAGDLYAILYQLDRGTAFSGPPLTAPDADVTLEYQISSSGKSRMQAQWLADKLRTLILGRTESGAFGTALPAIAGWRVADRLPSSAASGVQVEGVAPQLRFTVQDRYSLLVTPA